MQLHYQESGSGQPIVLLPGLVSSTRYWDHLIPRFPAAQYRLIRLDLLGFGQSPKPTDSAYDLTAHTTAVRDSLQHLGVEDAVVIAYSMSCALALHLAARYPSLVRRLVLIGPTIYRSRMDANHYAYQSNAIPRWIMNSPYARFLCTHVCQHKALAIPLYRLLARNVPLAVRDDARLHTWQSYHGTFENILLGYRAEADLTALKCPADILIGTHDQAIQIDYLEELASHNQRLRITVVPDVRHQLPNERPDLIVEAATRP